MFIRPVKRLAKSKPTLEGAKPREWVIIKNYFCLLAGSPPS